MSEKKFKVGQVWLTRDGEKRRVINIKKGSGILYPIITERVTVPDQIVSHNTDGWVYSWRLELPDDLISLHEDYHYYREDSSLQLKFIYCNFIILD